MSWFSEVDFVVDRLPMLQRGDRDGPNENRIREVQQLLRGLGYTIGVDGIFGPQTETVVMQFQRDHKLVVDGQVGEKTLLTLRNAKPNTRFLQHSDLVWAAGVLQVPVAAVMAVNEVESRGSGFFSNNRPAILFERHIMRRRLVHHNIDPAPHIQRLPNIVNTATGGYIGGVREYDRLDQAKAIHRPSGIESASWGLFQIMGFHWQHLDYQSAVHYMDEMHRSERNHLDAFVRFNMKDRRLVNALRTQAWADYARIYNGPAFDKHNPPYDVRLERAFAKHSKTVVDLKLAA
jgi:hypothetical protein